MSAYSKLAQFYNSFTHNDCDYSSWSQYLHTVLQRHNCSKGIDVACGTGKMTILLHKLGYDVMGFDSSIEMLNVAGRNSHNIKYACVDMTDIQLNKKVDFVTVVNDGVNYIPIRQLHSLFDNFYQLLNDNGVLIFDISSKYKLTSIVGNNCFFRDFDDVTCLWNNRLYNDRVVMDITLFEREGQHYLRYDEQHIQYIHQEQSIAQMLNSIGFDVVMRDCYTDTDINSTTERITIIASKGKQNGNIQ